MTIRSATPDDAEALLGIYAPYVAETAISFELEVPTVDDFRERITETLKHFPYLVAEENGKILGYCYAGKFRKRAAFNHCVETSIYVGKDNRQKGVGKALYAKLEKLLKEMGIINMNACIVTTDFPDEHLTPQSQIFHEGLGYVKCAHFHKSGLKFKKWYDIIWMEKMIGEHKV